MQYLETRIVYVDPSRGVFDSISLDGADFFEDTPYTNTGLKKSGDILNPEIGDVVVLSLNSDNTTSLHKFYASRQTTPGGLPTFGYGIGGNVKRNEILPGDRLLTGPDGSWLNLLRGGLASIGSSPLCQTIYSAMEGLVRTVAQNTDLISSGMRMYSLTDNGKIITRACFSSSDKHFAEGAEKNEDAASENFEYQIDITEDGISFFIGGIEPATKKRKNNLIIHLKPIGDISIQCGESTLIDLYSNGCSSYKIIDKKRNIIYNKTIGTNGEKVLLKEIIKGDVIRYVDGCIKEEATGEITRKGQTISNNASFMENTSMVDKTFTGLNIKEIGTAPSAQVKAI